MNASSPLLSSIQRLLCIFVVLVCGCVRAQEAMVRTSLATNDTIWVGQRVTIVVELLAPGIFASDAAFDLPDPLGLLLMPPLEHPLISSETINNTSYTVQRLELSAWATRAGEQSVPGLKARFAFKRAPLDTNEVPASVMTRPLRFVAHLPPGAESLGNVISAKMLKAEETWRPQPGDTNVPAGAAFTRTVTFSAPDVPGMVFPPFPAGQIDGLGIYTQRHVNDQTERGALQGRRCDVITYVCQRPGQFTIPAARLVWFDLEAKHLRTNLFPARSFTVVPNPALASTAAASIDIGSADIVSRQRTTMGWWLTALGMLLVLPLAFAGSARLRRLAVDFLALFRPVHLRPLNPTSTGIDPGIKPPWN